MAQGLTVMMVMTRCRLLRAAPATVNDAAHSPSSSADRNIISTGTLSPWASGRLSPTKSDFEDSNNQGDGLEKT